MPVVTGQVDSYQVPTNARDVSKAFPLIKNENTPFFNELPMPGVALNTKHFWWDDARQIRGTKLGAGYTSGALSLVVASSAGVRPGMIMQVDNTVYRATAVPDATHITVVVADGGADANHLINAKVVFLGVAAKEGSEYEDTDWTPPEERYNVTQIFNDWVNLTATEKAILREVDAGDLKVQMTTRKLERLYLQMAGSIFSSPRVVPANKATPRVMGGVDWFLTQYGLNATGTFNKDNFDAWLLDLESAGANLTELWMNPLDIKRFSALDPSESTRDRTDKTRGSYADTYISQYGHSLALRPDPQAPAGRIRMTPIKQFGLMPLQGRQFQVKDLGDTGDLEKAMIVGEYTLEVRNASTMGMFTPS